MTANRLPSMSGTESLVMELLRGSPISYGQKYRKLVIEDIVEAPTPR